MGETIKRYLKACDILGKQLLKCLNCDLGLLVGFNSSLSQLAWDCKAMLLLLLLLFTRFILCHATLQGSDGSHDISIAKVYRLIVT